jgi:tripartite-type tricarboxylate transporter receptor subunit TctC
MSIPMRLLAAAAATLAIAVAAAPATAQRYPDRPIRWIVPGSAGSYPDQLARLLAAKVSESIGQPIVIDNRPGAGTNLGTAIAAKAPPDGYTLFLHAVPVAINATLYAKLDYDPRKDFVPITQFTSVSNVLVVSPKLPVSSVSELLALANAKPGSVQYASAGSGTTAHLAGALLKSMTRADLTHVPYSNFNQGTSDVISGHVAMVIPNLPPVLPQIKAGLLKPLAVTGAKRSAALPDVPTMSEAGVKGYEVSSWHGLAVPTGTPQPIVDRLYSEFIKALKSPDVAARIAEMGADIVASTPAEYAAYVQSEIEKWGTVVREAVSRAD